MGCISHFYHFAVDEPDDMRLRSTGAEGAAPAEPVARSGLVQHQRLLHHVDGVVEHVCAGLANEGKIDYHRVSKQLTLYLLCCQQCIILQPAFLMQQEPEPPVSI